MTQHGMRITFYLQKELAPLIDKVLEGYPNLFQSRSHFINSAIVRELRRLNTPTSKQKQE